MGGGRGFARQAPLVAVGLPVTMTLDYLPGLQWQGAVDYLYPSLDEQTRTLQVRLRLPTRTACSSPICSPRWLSGPRRGAPGVPQSGVIRDPDGDRVVLALGDGRSKSVAVALGGGRAPGGNSAGAACGRRGSGIRPVLLDSGIQPDLGPAAHGAAAGSASADSGRYAAHGACGPRGDEP